MIEFDGLELPERCPSCNGAVREDRRFYKLRTLTAVYDCEAVLSTSFVNGGPDRVVQVTAGCRRALEKVLHPNAVS